ncbi:MAG: ROK family transcriptional regulator [Pseudomonadota bacterium]
MASDSAGAAQGLPGTSAAQMRERNERLVLTLVRRHSALPKAEIARMTGLSAQTVSVIMRALEKDGLLVRGEPVRGKVGQPSIPMMLAADGALFYGLKIGRRSADLVLVDFLGCVKGRMQIIYDHPAPDAAIRFAQSAVAMLQAGLGAEAQARVAGMGIGLPFQLWDWAEAIGVPAAAMAAWKDRDVRAELQARLAFPVYLENDATAACGAELVFGTEPLPANFLYYYVGYFVGGGVVVNNRLFTGPGGFAGALGSMPVPHDGGSAQLLELASLRPLNETLQSTAHEGAMWSEPESWEFDADAIAHWLRAAAHGLAYSIASATCVTDSDLAVIDGWLPRDILNRLVAQTNAALNGINLSGIRRPPVQAGSVGPDARALGAASLPLSRRFLVESLGDTAPRD